MPDMPTEPPDDLREKDEACRAAYSARRACLEAEPLPANIASLLVESCADGPERVGLSFIDSGEDLTMAEIRRRVSQLADSLGRTDIAKGSRVAVMLPNVPAFPVTWLALTWLGAVMVPVNIRYTPRELSYVLNDSEAGHLVIDREYLPTLEKMPERPAVLGADRVIVLGGGEGRDRHHDWDALVEAGTPGASPPADVGQSDLANIQYTSGTTGFPKGCLLTQRYWLTIGKVAAFRDGLELKQILIAQPFFYMDPQWLTLMAFYQRGTAHVALRPSARAFMGWVRSRGIEFCLFPEPVYRQPPAPEDADNRLKRVNVYGLRKDVHADLERRFKVKARESFGMTEVGSALTMPIEADHMTGSGSCGLPSAFRECRVVDEEGRDVPAGELGELVVRGPGIFEGYYNKPEANAAAFFGEWFRTGDLFRHDARGYFTIVGRRKDMVRRSGENIAAREVEAVLMGIDGVHEAAVIPVPDELRKEEVKAYLILDEGHSQEEISPDYVIERATAQLASFKVPRYLEYVTELPRTPSMKVKKDLLIGSKPDLRADSWDRVDQVWR